MADVCFMTLAASPQVYGPGAAKPAKTHQPTVNGGRIGREGPRRGSDYWRLAAVGFSSPLASQSMVILSCRISSMTTRDRSVPLVRRAAGRRR